jgi:hypothetical protein
LNKIPRRGKRHKNFAALAFAYFTIFVNCNLQIL